VLDPGFLFVPSDLAYFISFEEQDYQGRCRLAGGGIPSVREVLTQEMYRDYQASRGLIPSDASGGLYRRIMLKKFQPHIEPSVFTPLKNWHGAPMAALRRAFIALGSVRIATLGMEISNSLRQLQHLYCREPPIQRNAIENVPRGLFANPNKRKRDEDSEHTPPTCEHTERLYTGRQGVNSSELPVENRIFQTGTPGKTQRTEEACCSGRTELPINVLQSEAKEDWILVSS
jgi:hypothetical protein